MKKTKEQLQQERAALMTECDSLKGTNGQFATDEARTSFDTKMARVEAIDVEIRALDNMPAPAANASAAEVESARTAAIAEERNRMTTITTLCRTHKMDDTFAADLIARGVKLEDARNAILDKLAVRDSDPGNQHRQETSITGGDDARDKWIRGAANWLLVRSGMARLVAKSENITVDKITPGEFRGLTLVDLAKDMLERHGVSTRGKSRLDIAGMAMSFRSGNGYQTSSDFAVLLENVMHKVLRASYAVTPDTWSRWCGIGSASDFRAQNWYRLGALGVLEDLNEHGEFRNKVIPDAEKSTYSVGTKGNIIGITREVIVNDDLGFVMRLTEMLGRAGKLTIEKAAYSLLLQNGGLGPTQTNSQPLFHSSRANVGTGAAIGMTALDADASVMGAQLDPNGEEVLDLRPSILLVPRGLEGNARAINGAEYDPDTTGKLQKPNIVKGMFSDIVGTHRLTGNSTTRRYLFADPNTAPVFMVSFLEGQQEPVLETQDGWRFNGVEMKARLDFGVDVVDYRGAVTNAGV